MAKLTVADLMTREPIAVQPEGDLATAHDLMQEQRIRHLPVVDERGRVVGLLSHRDLLRESLFAQSGEPSFRTTLQNTRIGDVMVRRVTTVRADTDIRLAAQAMLEHKYGCLPVVEGRRRLIGILTEADFVRLLSAGDS